MMSKDGSRVCWNQHWSMNRKTWVLLLMISQAVGSWLWLWSCHWAFLKLWFCCYVGSETPSVHTLLVLWASQELNYSHMNLHGEKCDQHVLLLKLPTNIGGLSQWLMRAKRIEWTIPTLIYSHEGGENDTFSFWAQRAQERMEMLNAANVRTLQCVFFLDTT